MNWSANTTGIIALALTVVGSAALQGCDRNRFSSVPLFAMDSLLNAQAALLSQKQARVTKVMQLDESQAEVVLKPRSPDEWKKELEIFAVLENINKPINQDLYRSETYGDARSNLTVTAIITDAALPVRQLKIYYQKTPDRIKRIEGEYRETNSLYESIRFMKLEFEQVDETPLLTGYQITGGQKMVLSDSVQYVISGVLVNN
jgi:hypothetical protein